MSFPTASNSLPLLTIVDPDTPGALNYECTISDITEDKADKTAFLVGSVIITLIQSGKFKVVYDSEDPLFSDKLRINKISADFNMGIKKLTTEKIIELFFKPL